MNEQDRAFLEAARAYLSGPFCNDLLGPFVNNCVRGRQIICRDPECIARRGCKRFPQELRDLTKVG